MPPKQKAPLLLETHQPVNPDDFANRVSRLHAGVMFGDDPLSAGAKARRSWMLMDPIEAGLRPSDRTVAALDRAREIIELVPPKQARRQTWQVGRTAAQMGLDRAQTGIQLGMSRAQLEPDLDRTLEKAQATPNDSFESFSDVITAKTMQLHLKSKELLERPMEQWRRASTEAMLKVSLGMLIKESVGGLGALTNEYRLQRQLGKGGGHVSGRMVEAMYFTYQLMLAYRRKGTLAEEYPRFALYREDKPLLSELPRRNFDVVVASANRATDPKLVQVKTTHASEYAQPIITWTPNKQSEEIVDEAGDIMGWFNAIVDNEASDATLDAAWRNLAIRFAESAA